MNFPSESITSPANELSAQANPEDRPCVIDGCDYLRTLIDADKMTGRDNLPMLSVLIVKIISETAKTSPETSRVFNLGKK